MRVENVNLLGSLFLCPDLESGVDALLKIRDVYEDASDSA